MIPHTIDIAINGRYFEGKVSPGGSGPIYPGMLLLRGIGNYVEPNWHTSDVAATLIAIENKFAGTGVDTPYEIGDRVYARYCLPGDMFWGRSRWESLSETYLLSSAGHPDSGYLKATIPPVAGKVLIGIARGFSEPPNSEGFFVEVEVL